MLRMQTTWRGLISGVLLEAGPQKAAVAGKRVAAILVVVATVVAAVILQVAVTLLAVEKRAVATGGVAARGAGESWGVMTWRRWLTVVGSAEAGHWRFVGATPPVR